jgi:hypothetical protein
VSGHTPGSWNVTLRHGSFRIHAITREKTIARTPGADETNEANARLIVAAPDLLAALREWFGDENAGLFSDRASTDAAIARARAAIAKAEGR